MDLNSKKIIHNVSSLSGGVREISDKEKLLLQETLVSMLDDIQRACKEMHIEFVLCGGSCLGAVRHQGFIPWDDDIDIAMFRDDWDKLKKLFEKCLGNKYVLEAPNYDNRDSKYPWPKIYLKGTEYIDIFDVNYPYEHGISIDIFVIENVSKYRIIRLFDSFLATLFKFVATSMLFYKYPNRLVKEMFSLTLKSKLYYILRRGLGCAFSIFSHKRWLGWYDVFISRHHKSSDVVTIPTGTRLYSGEMLPRRVWYPYSKGVFCGHQVNLPHDPDAYLKNMYGNNYMQIPPKEKRETHSVVSLKL